MKKLMSVFAMVIFMAGMVVAQSNNSTVDQNGTGHDAMVNQNGVSNQSDINQDQGFNYNLDRGSKADVDQDGKMNSSSINSWGWNHEVYVNQEGDENLSAIKQSGGENDAYLDQIGDKNVLRGRNAGSAAFQKAGDPFGADKNYFDVDQTGDMNVVGMWQEHSAEALVHQNGNKNVSEIFQSGAPYGASNFTDVQINGDENMTDVYQYGDGNSSAMLVGHPNYISNSNEFSSKQTGDNNAAWIGLYKGDDNVVDIDQMGDLNYTELGIKYGSENEVTVDVDGIGNRSRMSISAQWGYMSSKNSIDLVQDGDGNYASGDIEGDRNVITLTQMGNNNRVGTSWYTMDGFDVYGEGNTITIEQMSDGNMSLNKVTGWNNTINVSQQ